MGNSTRGQQKPSGRASFGDGQKQTGRNTLSGGQGIQPGQRKTEGQRVSPITGKPAGQRNTAGVLAHSGQNERGKQGKGGNGRKKSRRKRGIIILVLILALLILLCLWLRSCGHDYGPFQDTQATEESHGQGSTENGSESGRDTEPDTEREYETDSSEDTQDTTEGEDSEDSEGTDLEKPSEPNGGSGENGPGKERLNLALSDSYRITDKHRIFYIGYPKDNSYDVRFTFMDENGKELYRTKYVAPGTNVAVDGTAFLQKGEQKLECLVSVYERQSEAKVSDCTTIVLNIKYE